MLNLDPAVIDETDPLTIFRNGDDYYVYFPRTGGNIGPFVDLDSCLNAAMSWLRSEIELIKSDPTLDGLKMSEK